MTLLTTAPQVANLIGACNMKWMRETTVWEDPTPNHLYLLDDDKCYAYIKAGTNEHKVFSKPMKFDLRRRTFKLVKEFNPK